MLAAHMAILPAARDTSAAIQPSCTGGRIADQLLMVRRQFGEANRIAPMPKATGCNRANVDAISSITRRTFLSVDQGNIDLASLGLRLRGRRAKAWVTAVCGNPVAGAPSNAGSEAAARLLTAQIVVGMRPPAWREQCWSYEECTFGTYVSSTAGLSSLLATPGERELTVGSVAASFALPETTWSWQRLPSLALYSQLALPWSSTEYKLLLPDQQTLQPPRGYLVGTDDAPSFPTFGAAYNAFFHDDFTVTSTGAPPLGQITVRIIDDRARITRVRIRPASLDVWIGGRHVHGARLELNGVADRTSVTLDKGGRVTLPLPHGLPADAWLWLKSGHEWLDFRALSGWGGRTSPDVENEELPKDPVAELTRLATQGEGQYLEYKSKLPETPEEKRTVFKTVVAFANGDGGTVLFGVADEGGAIVGLHDKVPASRRRLTDLLRDLVTPSPPARISTHRLEGRTILMLEVSPGNGTLHALTVNKNRPEYYVRRDGTTFYARPEEIAAVVSRRNGPIQVQGSSSQA